MLKCLKCSTILLNDHEIPSALTRYLLTFKDIVENNLFLCENCYAFENINKYFSDRSQQRTELKKETNRNPLPKSFSFNKQIKLECCDCSNAIQTFYISLPDNYPNINAINIKNIKGQRCNECTQRNFCPFEMLRYKMKKSALEINTSQHTLGSNSRPGSGIINHYKQNKDLIQFYYGLKQEERKMVENLIASINRPSSTPVYLKSAL